jgi:hypothetical protein
MEGENKDDGTGDPFKQLIEESLTQQRNEMMDSFVQILRQLPTSDTSSLRGGIAPLKVQINFNIPIFEDQIDANVVEEWLNLLEGYFSVHNFSNRENITFVLLKPIPHVKDWWETFYEQKETEETSLFTVMATWESFRDAIKEQYYPVRSYDDLYTKWTTLRQERDQAVPDFINIFHTLCTKLGIKDSERHMVLKYHDSLHRYIQTEMEFMDISSQNRAEAQTKDVAIWAWEPLTTKTRKGQPQPIEQRTKKIWTLSGQPVQSTSKEGHREDKKRYREVVQLA